ncbi:isochorismatase family protein [Sphingomonas sp. RB3P16]|uniref:cysteine hydrolase family protein n=1 Tax=Parasphingomonas frigoris TaxID=3096163 RepID=UPI002FC719D8
MRSIVLVIDTQADFLLPDGALAVAGAEALVAPMAAWLGTLRPETTAGVLFTFDTHFADTYPLSAEAKEFPIHCVRETPGWRNLLAPDLIDPAIPVHRLEKGVFAMWAEPGLRIEDARDPAQPTIERDGYFADLRAAGISDAIVIGVAADYCVRWAIDGLVERGFAVMVPSRLTRGIVRQIDQVVTEDFAGARVAVAE